MVKANHNKDYSVVKTFKVAQVAFFCALFKTNFAYLSTCRSNPDLDKDKQSLHPIDKGFKNITRPAGIIEFAGNPD